MLGGTKTPSERNVFTFEVRSSDEAEGDSRMMGCRRRGRFCKFATSAGWGAGTLGSEERARRNVAAILR